MSEVSICNAALTELGEEDIVSLDDNTKTARLCRLHYPRVRDDLLAAYRWNFCLRRANLTALTDPPVYGFSVRFELPHDLLRLWDTDIDNCPWRVEGDELLTDAGEASILYSVRVTDTAQFSTGFRRCVELDLASRMAFAITRLPAVSNTFLEQFRLVLDEARTYESQENAPETYGPATLVTARLEGGVRGVPFV